jgi:catechol 2,3-dioxygenase-like lactoylglutathione lyase family enzyme
MQIRRILETCINVESVPQAREWYQRLFGFEVMEADERFCAFNVGHQDVLLLFQRGSSKEPLELPGGTIPPHDTYGAGHFAFGIPEDELPEWRKRLELMQVRIESTMAWPRGGTSLYFRDPDSNLLELATPGVWPIY